MTYFESLFENETIVDTAEKLAILKDSVECLYVSDRREDFFVDFEKYPNLVHLRCDIKHKYRREINSLNKIEQLILFGFTAKKESLSNLNCLRRLTLSKGSFFNLNFLPKASKLNYLEINSISKLKDVTDLKSMSDSLRELDFNGCKNIEDPEATLSMLKYLEVLKCNNVIFENLKWIRNLPNLKQLILLDSDVIDGDISHAKDISYVAIDNKRHYNYRFNSENRKIIAK